MKKPVTDDTFLAHLKGKRPYGVYLLNGDRTKAIAADFDDLSALPPFEFVNAAQHYGLPAYIETSKSKGFHVWIFFNAKGVKASKARLVVKHILEEIEHLVYLLGWRHRDRRMQRRQTVQLIAALSAIGGLFLNRTQKILDT